MGLESIYLYVYDFDLFMFFVDVYDLFMRVFLSYAFLVLFHTLHVENSCYKFYKHFIHIYIHSSAT